MEYYAIYRMGVISNDLERRLTQIVSDARHYLTLNISKTVHDGDNGILIGTYTRRTQRCDFELP